MRILVGGTVIVLLAFASMANAVPGRAATTSAQQPGHCEFLLGFKALHDLIPSTVGDCIEDEYHNPDNGDALQHTTTGLLVWRKADNWTAFTDGSTTWINGPDGLVSRPNDGPYFPWEATSGMSGGSSGIDGMVTIGSTCPGPISPGQTCQQPYQAMVTVLDQQGGVVAQAQSDASGHFQIPLPPGTYTLHPNSPAGLPLPFARDQTVMVPLGQFTPVQITYESGVR
jgi:hypothetical protein